MLRSQDARIILEIQNACTHASLTLPAAVIFYVCKQNKQNAQHDTDDVCTDKRSREI